MDLEKASAIITKYNVDGNGNPVSVNKTETQQVHPTKNVIESNIMDEFNRVEILNKTMYEVNNLNEVKSDNQYYVDYNNGRIYFHPSLKGQSIQYRYGDVGKITLSANNVFTKVNDLGEVIEYLSDFIVRVENKLVELKENLDTYKEVLDSVEEAEILINQLHEDVIEANIVQPILANDIQEGKNVKAQLDESIADAQEDIATIKATGNTEILILASEWTLNNGIYEKQITHDLNSDNAHVSARNSDTKESVTIGYKIVDKSKILLKSDEAINMSVVLNASYYKPMVFTNVDEGEIIRARKGETSLDVKIGKIDTAIAEHSTSLDSKANKTETQNIQQQVNNLVLGAVGDGNNAEVIQSRGDYNVLNERLNSYDNIKNYGVMGIKSKNMFNKNDVIPSTYLNSLDGTLFTNRPNSSTSIFIKVKPDCDYYGFGTENTVAYDISKKYISKLTNTTGTFRTPSNCAYIRTCCDNSSLEKLQIEEGTIKTSYQKFGATIDNASIKYKEIDVNKIKNGYRLRDINNTVICTNIYNSDNVCDGYGINILNGELVNADGYLSSDYETVESNTIYTRNYTGIVGFYNDNLEYISGISDTVTQKHFTTPINCKYARFSFLNSLKYKYQVEKGSINTPLQPYTIQIPSLDVGKRVITSMTPNALFTIYGTHKYIAVGIYDYDSSRVYVNDLTTGTFKITEGSWTTESANKGYPANCNFLQKVITFKGKLYGIGIDNSDKLWKMWRADVTSNNDPLIWGEPVWIARDNIVSQAVSATFNCNSNYIFIGEYGFRNEKGAKIWRSANGSIWEEVYTLDNSLHCHGLNCDPYNEGHVWMASGEPEGLLYFSSNNGTTWEKISTEYGYQSVQISFTKNNVYFADDSTQQTCVVVNKKKKIPFILCNNHHSRIGVYGAKALEDKFYNNAFYGAVTEEGVYYSIIQDVSSGGTTSGIARSLGIGEDLSIIRSNIEILKTPTDYNLLAECYITKDKVFFNQYWMKKTRVRNLMDLL